MTVHYLAKANGTLRAVAELPELPDFTAITAGTDVVVPVGIFDGQGGRGGSRRHHDVGHAAMTRAAAAADLANVDVPADPKSANPRDYSTPEYTSIPRLTAGYSCEVVRVPSGKLLDVAFHRLHETLGTHVGPVGLDVGKT